MKSSTRSQDTSPRSIHTRMATPVVADDNEGDRFFIENKITGEYFLLKIGSSPSLGK